MSPGSGRSARRSLRCFALVAIAACVSAPARADGPRIPAFGGSVAESVSASMAIDGNPGWADVACGSATDLDLSLDLESGDARAHFDARISVLGGSRAQALWAQVAALEASGGLPGILMAPGYQSIPGRTPPTVLAAASVRQAYLSVSSDGMALDAGRLPVNFGVGKAFSPVDIFAGKDWSGALPARLSSDVARIAAFPSSLICAEIVAAPFGPARSPIASSQAAELPVFAGRLSTYGSGAANGIFSGALVAARRGNPWTPSITAGAWTAGAELKADLPFASVYAEAAWRLPDGSTSPAASGEWDAMVGIDTGLDLGFGAGPGDAVILAEYALDTAPAADSSLHRAFASVSARPDDWTALGFSGLWHIDSGLFSGALRATLLDLWGTDATFSVGASRSADSSGGNWSILASATALISF